MSNFLDDICKLRNIIQDKDLKMLERYNFKISQIKEQLIRLMRKKSQDYKFELELTAQDLRELSSDISNLFKHWNNKMNPDKNIKSIFKKSEVSERGKKVNFDKWTNSVEPIMRCRTRTVQALTELLSISQFFAVYLYYVELASRDEFAINFTERVL